MELTPLQIAVLERLVGRGFHLVAFPLYASAIGVRRDSHAALLVPVESGGLRLLGQPCVLIDGNLSVAIEREGVRYFVWKSRRIEATPTEIEKLNRFGRELEAALSTQS